MNIIISNFEIWSLFWKKIPALAEIVVAWYIYIYIHIYSNLVMQEQMNANVFCYCGDFLEER